MALPSLPNLPNTYGGTSLEVRRIGDVCRDQPSHRFVVGVVGNVQIKTDGREFGHLTGSNKCLHMKIDTVLFGEMSLIWRCNWMLTPLQIPSRAIGLARKDRTEHLPANS